MEDINDNNLEDSCKPFKLPCITKYDDLMAKFSGKLEIRCLEDGNLAMSILRPVKRPCIPAKEFGKNDHIINDLSESNHFKQNGRNGESTARGSSRGSSGPNSSSADSPDEVQFRAPQPPVMKKRTTKKRFSAATSNTSTTTTTTTSTNRRNSTDTSNTGLPTNRQSSLVRRSEEAGAKPGTVGSRQTVRVSQRAKREQQQQVLNQRQPNIFGGLKINPAQDLIDTKNFVEDTMIMFLPELCKRAGIDPPPKDPLDLCLKFDLIVPDVDLETEPEIIDMTGDRD